MSESSTAATSFGIATPLDTIVGRRRERILELVTDVTDMLQPFLPFLL